MINPIIDMYHGNSIDLDETLAGGVVAIIPKATEAQPFTTRNITSAAWPQRR